MIALRADGTTVTLRGPSHLGALWTTAPRGPARIADLRKRRKRPSVRKRLKSTSVLKDAKASIANSKNLFSQRLRGLCLQIECQRSPVNLLVYPNRPLALNPHNCGPPRSRARSWAREAAPPSCLWTRSSIPGPIHSVTPDLVGGSSPPQSLGPVADLYPDLNLQPYPAHVPDQDQDLGPDTIPGHNREEDVHQNPPE